MDTTITQDGFEILEGFLSELFLEQCREQLKNQKLKTAKGGIRNAEQKFPLIKNFITSQKFINTASKFISGKPQLVRVILFDKTEKNNWFVTWHQDRTITMPERIERKGWGPWTKKDGVHNVQPPLEVLNNMVTFRIHLDDSLKDNGCLNVIKGSHKFGILSADEIKEKVENHDHIECEVRAGDAIIMRPHILHSSNKSENPKNRRIIHVEFRGNI
ncbi:MAG: phytanoyl-CoA dioxygenase family protein [Emcibacteraceae bacterium]|nr:phytanoyl-CoA dioxygenase family protein [Emcibacteraceae bacterium]